MGRFNTTERLGIYKSAIIFHEELSWVFREQPLVDVGIDALIEESVDGNPTGKFLAAQVKTGVGNFLSTGNSFILYVSRIHHTYWLNLDLPIILLACIPEDGKVYWELINAENLKETKKSWKLEISKNKILGKSSKAELTNIIYRKPQKDFLTQLQSGEISEESLNELLKESSYFNESLASLDRLSEIISIATEVQNKFVADLESYQKNGFTLTHASVKSAIKQYSYTLNSASNQLENEINTFSDSFAHAFREFEKLQIVHFYLFDDYENVKVNFDRLSNFVLQIENAIEAINSVIATISALPNLNTQFKIAKRNLIETMKLIASEFKVSKEMSLNFQKALDEILN